MAAADRIGEAWLFLAASSAFYFLSANEVDNDLWVHVLVGREMLATREIPRVDHLSYTLPKGQPWVDHEWLTQALLGAAYEVGGGPALFLLKLFVALSTAFAMWRMVARGTNNRAVGGLVMMVSVSVLARGFAVRPQIVSYFAVALLLWWLDRYDARERKAAPNSQLELFRSVAVVACGFAVWANAHGAFVFGLVLLLCRAAIPPWPIRGSAWVMLLVAVLATFLNPFGPGLYSYLAGELTTSHPISEWQPIRLTDPAHGAFFALVIATIVTLPFARLYRRDPWRLFLAVGVGVMAFRHQRHTPLFALCAAGPLAQQLDDFLLWLRKRFGWNLSIEAQAAIAVGVAGLAVLQLGLSGSRLWRDGGSVTYDAVDYPLGAVQYIRKQKLSGNLALPLDWGGYVLWHTAPAIKVSLDGRFATIYPPDVVQKNFELFYGTGPEAFRLIREYPTTLVLAPSGSLPPIRRDPAWRIIYRDDLAQLYAKDSSAEPVVRLAQRGRLQFPGP